MPPRKDRIAVVLDTNVVLGCILAGSPEPCIRVHRSGNVGAAQSTFSNEGCADLMAITTSTYSSQFHLLSELYAVRNPEEVSEFLEEHGYLIDVLSDLRGKLRDYFDEQVALELTTEPDDAYARELFARIMTRMPPSQALELLDKFDDDWWLDAASRARGDLNVTLEYL